MMKTLATKAMLAAGAATVAISAVSAPAEAASFTVTVEAPGVQSSLVPGTTVEDWDAQPTDSPATYSSTLGTYKADQPIDTAVFPASALGGAGGEKQYVSVAGLPPGSTPATLTLELTNSQKYFGLWWSAVDAANKIEFFDNTNPNPLFSLDTPALLSFIGGNPGYNGGTQTQIF
jgi:hypothetical protein